MVLFFPSSVLIERFLWVTSEETSDWYLAGLMYILVLLGSYSEGVVGTFVQLQTKQYCLCDESHLYIQAFLKAAAKPRLTFLFVKVVNVCSRVLAEYSQPLSSRPGESCECMSQRSSVHPPWGWVSACLGWGRDSTCLSSQPDFQHRCWCSGPSRPRCGTAGWSSTGPLGLLGGTRNHMATWIPRHGLRSGVGKGEMKTHHG